MMLTVVSWMLEGALASQSVEVYNDQPIAFRKHDGVVMKVSPLKEVLCSVYQRDRDALRKIHDRALRYVDITPRDDISTREMIYRLADYIARDPSPISYVEKILMHCDKLAEYTLITYVVQYVQEKRRDYYKERGIPDDDEELRNKTELLLKHMNEQIMARRAVEPKDFLHRKNGYLFFYDAMVYLFSEHDKGADAVRRRFCMMLATAVEDRKLAEAVEDRMQAVEDAKKKRVEVAAEREQAVAAAKKDYATALKEKKQGAGRKMDRTAVAREKKLAVAFEHSKLFEADIERKAAINTERERLKEAIDEKDNDLKMFNTIAKMTNVLLSATFIRDIKQYGFEDIVLLVTTSQVDLRAVKFLDEIGLGASTSLRVPQYITTGQHANVSPCFVLRYIQNAIEKGAKDAIWAESVAFKFFTEAGMSARLRWLHDKPEFVQFLSARVLCHVLYYVWKDPELDLGLYINVGLKYLDKQLLLRTLTRTLTADGYPGLYLVLIEHCPQSIRDAWAAYIAELSAQNKAFADAAGEEEMEE
ncbi:hypothetical protein PAPHI01_1945 [Pancytospora philotis]|nr:hypothetical protein PAPHI01_1945 [Pancytospora philotis]